MDKFIMFWQFVFIILFLCTEDSLTSKIASSLKLMHKTHMEASISARTKEAYPSNVIKESLEANHKEVCEFLGVELGLNVVSGLESGKRYKQVEGRVVPSADGPTENEILNRIFRSVTDFEKNAEVC
eukprot:Platyproteum_vivax@DN4476_c0_g1_i2.p1